MWFRDSYSFFDGRHRTVTAVWRSFRDTPASEMRSRSRAAEIITELARSSESRRHLIALCEGSLFGADRHALVASATTVLVSQLLRAVDSGRLVFVGGQVSSPDLVSRPVVSLIERLIPNGRRLVFDGHAYRLAPAHASETSPDREQVVLGKDAGPLLLRMRDKVARSVDEKQLWEQAVALLWDEKDADTRPGRILLLRVTQRLQVGSSPLEAPASPAVPRSPAPLIAQNPMVEELEREFGCPEEQAEALSEAAQDGMPFCAECMCAEAAEKAA